MKLSTKPARTPKITLRKGDVVNVISGSDAGSTGKVLQVFPTKGRVLVEGVNFAKKHLRKSQDNPQGGIIDKEAPLAISNVAVQSTSKGRGK